MSNVLYYYAKINENDVCYGFETLTKKFSENEQPSNLVYLPDYNESVLWKKWVRELKAWSSEKYEPSIDTILQDKVEQLETENINLQNNIQNLTVENADLKTRVADLEEVIANSVGGAM